MPGIFDHKLPSLPAVAPLTGSEALYVVQNGFDRRVSAAQLATFVGSGFGLSFVSVIDQALIDATPNRSTVYMASAVTVEQCTIVDKLIHFIFQPGLVTFNGTVTFEGCSRGIWDGNWATFKWHGTTGIPMFKLSRCQYLTFRQMYISCAPFDHPMDSAFWLMSTVGGGQVMTQCIFEDIFVDGTNAGGLQYAWRIGVQGDSNGDNNDFHRFMRVAVSNYDIAGYSIEQPECKFITFHDCGFSGNGFGQHGVTTWLNGGKGGSFLFLNGGGGGNTVADFAIGEPDDIILIQGCQLESSVRVMDTSASSSSQAITIRDCRMATDSTHADGKIVKYNHRGPFNFFNNTISNVQLGGIDVQICLGATGTVRGFAWGNNISSNLANPFTTSNSFGKWNKLHNTLGDPSSTVIPEELPDLMMAGPGVNDFSQQLMTNDAHQTVWSYGANGQAYTSDSHKNAFYIFQTRNAANAVVDLYRFTIDDDGKCLIPGLSTTVNVEFVIDGGGSVITTGVKGDLDVGFNGRIVAATLMADVVGSIVVDVWKRPYASYPPSVADKITSATPPTLTAANKSQDTTLSGWTTAFSVGDVFRFNVNSASTVKRVTLSLKCLRDGV